MKRAAILAGLLIAGCSQTTQRQFEYIDRVTEVQMPDTTYRIREHPQRDRLMVSPSWGQIVGGGIVRGSTLGLVDILPADQPRAAAAIRHMELTGRSHCRILQVRPLMEPHVEVLFDCSGSAD